MRGPPTFQRTILPSYSRPDSFFLDNLTLMMKALWTFETPGINQRHGFKSHMTWSSATLAVTAGNVAKNFTVPVANWTAVVHRITSHSTVPILPALCRNFFNSFNIILTHQSQSSMRGTSRRFRNKIESAFLLPNISATCPNGKVGRCWKYSVPGSGTVYNWVQCEWAKKKTAQKAVVTAWDWKRASPSSSICLRRPNKCSSRRQRQRERE